MKNIIVISMFLMTTIMLQAQTYTGIVNNSKGEAISFANIALHSLPDSVFIAGTTTNEKGEFTLNEKPIDKAYLEISFVGYNTVKIPLKADVGTITLSENINELGEVVVKNQLPQMEQKDDALVTTIHNSILEKAGTANDVLKRLPMINEKNGEYSVFGKGKAKIFINNRALRDASELERLNSDNIKDVEIVTNPGARYDASVKAVIRINTKKKVGDGFSIDLRSTYNQSENVDLVEQLKINYRKNNWDFFQEISYKKSTYLQIANIDQITEVDTLWKQHNDMNVDIKSDYLTSVTGINYVISKQHAVGVKYTYRTKLEGEVVSRAYNNISANNNFYDRWISSNIDENDNSPKHIVSAYYNGTIGKLGISLDATFFSKKQGLTTLATETGGSIRFGDRTIHSTNDVNNRLFATKFVISYPVLKGKLSVGNDYTNTYRQDEFWADKIVRPAKTRIEQQSNSLFVEYSKSISIGQISGGLRFENVQADYYERDQLVKEQSKHYQQWFPNLSFSTQIKKIGIQLSYTAKTKRPTYQQLSSNVFYSNRFTLQTGNPFLDPSIMHDVTLLGSWKFIQLMLSYNYEKNYILYWMEQTKENQAISLIKYINVDKLPQLTTFLTLSPKWGIWSPQLSLGMIKQWITVESRNKNITLNKALPIVNLNNSFELPKNFIFTLDAKFQGSGNVQNVYLQENIFAVNVGVHKSFFNNKLSVAIKGNDIFKTKKESTLLYNAKMSYYQNNRFDTREFEITIRYKFNTTNSKYKGTDAGKSEIDRM